MLFADLLIDVPKLHITKKAKLALLGIVAAIESTKGGDNAVWYRVKIGPLSKESARQVKSRLVEEKFEVLVLIKDG